MGTKENSFSSKQQILNFYNKDSKQYFLIFVL